MNKKNVSTHPKTFSNLKNPFIKSQKKSNHQFWMIERKSNSGKTQILKRNFEKNMNFNKVHPVFRNGAKRNTKIILLCELRKRELQ